MYWRLRLGFLSACTLGFGLLTLAGCVQEGERRPLNVFAASSLTEAFQDMENAFELQYADTDVVLNFGGSQLLRLQIEQGARADIFASADRRQLDKLIEAGIVAEPKVFTRNELVVIVPTTNPAGIESFADLPHASRLAIGAEEVPVGMYTGEVLRAASEQNTPNFAQAVYASVVSQEANVRLVRAKVELGEVDAAIVYRTDVVPGRVRAIPIPAEVNADVDYVIAALVKTNNVKGATRWLTFVASTEGRRILSARGFDTTP